MNVVVSGLVWMGSGVGSIETAVERMLASAEREVVVVSYALTSGAKIFFRCVEECLVRGVRVAMIVNRLSDQDPVALANLSRLAHQFANFTAFDFTNPAGGDLHAKLIVVDRRQAIVGSANLSWNGLVANHELALVVDDRASVDWMAEAADRLFRSSLLRPFYGEPDGPLASS